MRPYLIALGILAFAAGGLFRAADMTGVKLIKMAGVIGIFLFGLFGSMALVRWQGESGRREIEKALKGLGRGYLVTDWSASGPRHGIPEYLVVSPGGLISLVLFDAPRGGQRTWPQRIARARAMAQSATDWVAQAMVTTQAGQGAGQCASGAEAELEMAIKPVVVLTRRKAETGDSSDGVQVVNPDGLQQVFRSQAEDRILSEEERVNITRHLRTAAAALGHKRLLLT